MERRRATGVGVLIFILGMSDQTSGAPLTGGVTFLCHNLATTLVCC